MVLDKLNVKEGIKFIVVSTNKIPQLKAIWTWTEEKKCIFNRNANNQRITNIFELMSLVTTKKGLHSGLEKTMES